MNISDHVSNAKIPDMLSAPSAPKGWEPGVTFDPNTSVPSTITTPPIEKLDANFDWREVVRSMNIDLPSGYELRLAEMKYDPAAWHRDTEFTEHPETGNKMRTPATTRPVYRYRFVVVKSDLFSALDLPALYAELSKKPKAASRAIKNDTTLVVAWADIQTGKVDHLGGVADMLERLDSKRSALEAHIKKVKPNHIVIVDAGDIIEGFENVESQKFTNGLSLMDQVDVAATELQKTITLCRTYASDVDVLSVPSNHCQSRRGKGLTGTPHDDWGLYINKRLEQLNEAKGNGVKFTRSPDWDETLTFPIRNTSIAVAHGHQASGGVNGVINWWAKMVHSGKMNADICLTGHYHYFSVRPSGRNPETGKARWHLQAPTLDNGSAWVANKMGEDGDPGLLTFCVNDEGFDLQSLTIL